MKYYPSYSETGVLLPDTMSYPLTISDLYARDNGIVVGNFGIGGGGYLGQAFELNVPTELLGYLGFGDADDRGLRHVHYPLLVLKGDETDWHT